MLKFKYYFFLGLQLLFLFQNCKKILTHNTHEIISDSSASIRPDYAVDIGQSQIPYIIISTSDTILTDPKIQAKMKIYQRDSLLIETIIGIEYRGSTSFRLSDKKSYGIEIWDSLGESIDINLFGFPQESDWVLIGDVYNNEQKYRIDPTLISHYLAYHISNSIGRYASRTQLVELQLNNEYLGIYMLGEKLKRNSERINIKKLGSKDNSLPNLTGGYILKIDKTAGDDVNPGQPLSYYLTNWADDAAYSEKLGFRSNYSIHSDSLDFAPFGPKQPIETYFLYEYPKFKDITVTQKNYIKSYIDSFEYSLKNDDFSTNQRTYTNFIDLSSFVDYFIINELCHNIDAYRISTFMFKDNQGKLNLGPVWDFNIGYYWGDRVPFDDWIVSYNTYNPTDTWQVPFWWKRLLADPVFLTSLKVRWQDLRKTALANATLLNLITTTANYLIENKAISRNFNKWNKIPEDYNSEIEKLKQFFISQLARMDTKISLF